MFLTKHKGGMVRFADQILLRLDQIAKPNEFELVIPAYVKQAPNLENIPIVRYGSIKNLLWEQISFRRYVKKKRLIGVNLIGTCPIGKPDVVAIHDISQLVHPEWYSNFYGFLSKAYHKAMYRTAKKRAKLIITVSQFSKSELVRVLKVDPERILVAGNGWEHVDAVEEDDSIFDRNPKISKGDYYLSISSITPQKNFCWVEMTASLNPGSVFVIGGERVGLTTQQTENRDNLIYLGRVSDAEMKALMSHCKAFIHPAKYEGFGITPLEALSVGAKLIIANSSCLPEIYGDSAVYIDPNKPVSDIDNYCRENAAAAAEVLKKYTWENMAKIIYKGLSEL